MLFIFSKRLHFYIECESKEARRDKIVKRKGKGTSGGMSK